MSAQLPQWLALLLLPQENPGVAASLVCLFLALFLGLLLGKIKIKKVSLGTAGVVFAGLLLGHLGYRLEVSTQEFIRDLGLILFVYAIGMQLGPSFFSRLKQNGWLYNGLAAGTVVMGMLITSLLHWLLQMPIESLSGVMAGAVTNTPSLGAAKAALAELSKHHQEKVFADPTLTYAIAYPFGIVAIILLLIVAKWLYKTKPQEQLLEYKNQVKQQHPEPENVKIRVNQMAWFGKTLKEWKAQTGIEVIFSRLKRSGSEVVISPDDNTILKERDILMAVGNPIALEKAVASLGYVSKDTFIESEKFTRYKNLVVTKDEVIQKSLGQLQLEEAYHARATRVYRSGLSMLAEPELILHYGDTLRVVGSEAALESIEKLVGNSEKKIQEPQMLSIFAGIVLGVILGSIPFLLPGLSAPVKLGMAAGPLIVAILISRFGGIRTLHSYLQQSALSFMKELGICLFFASIGIHGGAHFYETFVNHNGFMWILLSLCITLIPGILLLLVSRYVIGLNLIPLLGLVAGSHTDPAALEFANNYYKTDLPLQSYATVYPLVTLLRIVSAQLLILYLT